MAVHTLAQVTDVKATTRPLDYPAEADAGQLDEIVALFAQAKGSGGGAGTVRAMRRIEAMGFVGFRFLVNQLREIDYRSYDDLRRAEWIHLTLTDMTLGADAGFVPAAAGDDPGRLDPRIAQWDAITVAKWIGLAQSQWPSSARWDEYIARRKEERDSEPGARDADPFAAWRMLDTLSLDKVLDPRTSTRPLEFPPEVTEADKKDLAALYQQAKDGGGGARTGLALKEMDKMGVGGLYFIINRLRELDYKKYDDVVWAHQLNLTLLDLTLGVNTGFVPVEAGADPGKLDPRIAQWDAMTVEKWIGGAQTLWPTKGKWDEYIAKRKARKDAELDEGGKK